MKTITLSLCLVLAAFTTAFGQKQLSIKAFESFCDSSGMKFTLPEGYSVHPVKENPDLWYSFAIINSDSSMEVRYTIWPLAEQMKAYEASLKDSTTMMVNPNNTYGGRIQANALNMSGGQMPQIGGFPAQAVKKEFNADVGGSCFFNFNCEFGKGYQVGQFIFLHKDNVADAIITFMSNDKSTHSDNMMMGFHSLIFK